MIIRRRNAEDVALVSAEELASLLETAHLLRSPRNAQRLLTAINRALGRRLSPSSVEDLRRELGLVQEGRIGESPVAGGSGYSIPNSSKICGYWANTNRKTALRAFDLIQATLRDPFSGIGKPEPLKYLPSGTWSRRLTEEHRIVYMVSEGRVDFPAGAVPLLTTPAAGTD